MRRDQVFQALWVCAGLVGVFPAKAADDEVLLATLEAQVARQEYLEAAGDVYRFPEIGDRVIAWLRRQAEAGIPPLQYELSRRIWSATPEEALKWYARGYTARSLDFAQCTDRPTNQLYVLMLGMYSPLRDKALAEPKRYAAALEEAISWNANRSKHPGPEWICQKGVLAEPHAKQARDKQLQELREGIERLRVR